MSQAGIINTSSGPVPPTVATTYVTDVNSPAIPAANILNVLGNDTTANNANGLQTDGSSGSNTLTVQLTNRLQGTTSTVGLTNSDIITFSLGATPAAFKFHFEVTAFESTTPAGLGYSIEASARTTGAAATIISTPDADEDEDVVLENEADWSVVASGNNVILRVTGVTGFTLNWSAVGYYIMVS